MGREENDTAYPMKVCATGGKKKSIFTIPASPFVCMVYHECTGLNVRYCN